MYNISTYGLSIYSQTAARNQWSYIGVWLCWLYGWVLPFLARRCCWHGCIVHTKRTAGHWMLKNKSKKSNPSPIEMPWHGKAVPGGAFLTRSRIKYFLGKIIIGGKQGPAEPMQRVTAAKDLPTFLSILFHRHSFPFSLIISWITVRAEKPVVFILEVHRLTLRLLMSYIYVELLVKPEMLTSYIYGPTFGNAETVSFYLLHNVSTLNQCREVFCVTFVCKHFAS